MITVIHHFGADSPQLAFDIGDIAHMILAYFFSNIYLKRFGSAGIEGGSDTLSEDFKYESSSISDWPCHCDCFY